MAEWLFEAGIGEDRAALVEDGEIVEARIDRDDGRPRAGDVLAARLVSKSDVTGRATAEFVGGGHGLLKSLPAGISIGALLLVEIVREAIPEGGHLKAPKLRAVTADGPKRAPNLFEEVSSTGLPVRQLRSHESDALEEAGWSDLLEEATTGIVPFVGGTLRISLTPAMTLIDVDGLLPRTKLARLGAGEAGRAIRRFDIGGSIGIDLPTVPDKVARQAAAAALDAELPQPFERTAVNGFGFLQVVRRRVRSSLLELVQSDSVGTAALALLRRAERQLVGGRGTLVAAPKVIARIEREQQWMLDLVTRTRGLLNLRADPALPISAGHVEDRIA